MDNNKDIDLPETVHNKNNKIIYLEKVKQKKKKEELKPFIDHYYSKTFINSYFKKD